MGLLEALFGKESEIAPASASLSAEDLKDLVLNSATPHSSFAHLIGQLQEREFTATIVDGGYRITSPDGTQTMLPLDGYGERTGSSNLIGGGSSNLIGGDEVDGDDN